VNDLLTVSFALGHLLVVLWEIKLRATKVNTETNTDPVISYDAANQTCTVSPRLVDASMQTNFPHMMPEDLKGDDDKTRFYTRFLKNLLSLKK
jgi:hypothetical protein